MEKNRITSEEQWGLVAKYLGGEATDMEKTVVENWIEESDENRDEFNRCLDLYKKTDAYFLAKKFDPDKAFEAVGRKTGIIGKVEQGRGKIILPKFFKYAAAAMIFLAIGIASWYFISVKGQENMLVQATHSQEQKTVTLPDGTNITLNGNTRIVFPEDFTGDSRNVEIEGEAFFDVEPNPAKPFIIKAGDTQIRVLGTSFNVLAYPDAETVEVVVETGKVQVTGKTGSDQISNEVFLEPGEKATVTKKIKSVVKKVNDDPNYNSWKTGNFVFEKSTLSYVIETLEKSFQVEINVSDPEIENLKYSVKFENKPIEYIMDVIRLTFNLELTIEGNIYYLSRRTN